MNGRKQTDRQTDRQTASQPATHTHVNNKLVFEHLAKDGQYFLFFSYFVLLEKYEKLGEYVILYSEQCDNYR